jgi:hypothetical protein
VQPVKSQQTFLKNISPPPSGLNKARRNQYEAGRKQRFADRFGLLSTDHTVIFPRRLDFTLIRMVNYILLQVNLIVY